METVQIDGVEWSCKLQRFSAAGYCSVPAEYAVVTTRRSPNAAFGRLSNLSCRDITICIGRGQDLLLAAAAKSYLES